MHTKLAGCWADGSQKNDNEPDVRRHENRRRQQQIKSGSAVLGPDGTEGERWRGEKEAL